MASELFYTLVISQLSISVPIVEVGRMFAFEILKNPSYPTPVSDDPVENVSLLEKHVGAYFLGTDFDVGDSVFFEVVPLTSLCGVIDRLDCKKLHIYVDAIPGSVMIEVEPHQVQSGKDVIYQLVTKR